MFRDFASEPSEGFDIEPELEYTAQLGAITSRGVLRPKTVQSASDGGGFASERAVASAAWLVISSQLPERG